MSIHSSNSSSPPRFFRDAHPPAVAEEASTEEALASECDLTHLFKDASEFVLGEVTGTEGEADEEVSCGGGESNVQDNIGEAHLRFNPGSQSSPNSPQITQSLDRITSQFTYRHFIQMASYSTTTPLRIIAHVDLDAFYAQCEMVRLGTAENQSLAVQQWGGLIAVNYPARAFGISRMDKVHEAKEKCPSLIAQHVATWKEGDDKWAYHPDAFENMGMHKAALDPYRKESRKILKLLKEYLPRDQQRIEKAGIDEVFLDLSAQVHSIMLSRYPDQLREPPEGANWAETSLPPLPPHIVLDWTPDSLIDVEADTKHGEEQGEEQKAPPDWDDVALLVASEIVRGLRATVRRELGYTCSAGLSRNKMLSKLGSACNKPNGQTVIRTRAIAHFLSGFKFTKIRMMGGKLGEKIATIFGTETVEGLLAVPLATLKARLGDDVGVWVHNTVRGIDSSEVSTRTHIKSMLSAKAFRHPRLVSSLTQAASWLRIFSRDIHARLIDDGVLDANRRPKSLTLHYVHGNNTTRSRMCTIPLGKPMTADLLFDLSLALLRQVESQGDLWPCTNLSVAVSAFEEGVTGNMGIGTFLVKDHSTETAVPGVRRMNGGASDAELSSDVASPRKKRKVNELTGIQQFFVRGRGGVSVQKSSSASSPAEGTPTSVGDEPIVDVSHDPGHETSSPAANESPLMQSEGDLEQELWLTCSKCPARFHNSLELQSHQDWHFAKELSENDRATPTLTTATTASGRGGAMSSRPGSSGASSSSTRGRGRGSRRPRGGRRLEQGQSRLRFG